MILRRLALVHHLRWGGLRFKIVAWTFLPTAAILIAVGLVSFYAFQRTTRSLLIDRNQEVIRLTANQLSVELNRYLDILSQAARYPGFASRNAPDQRAALLSASSSLLVFDGGVLVANETGTVTAASPDRQDLLGANLADRAYFREIVRSREPVFSDVVTDGPGASSVVLVAVPVTNIQNEFVGVAAGMFRIGALSVSPFYADIVKLRIGKNDYAHLNAYLVDGKGKVIYHSDSALIDEDFSKVEGVSRLTRGISVSMVSRDTPAAEGFQGSGGALRARDASGRDVVAYHSEIPGSPWILVSESSWSGILSYYRNYLLAQTLLFVLGVAFPALVVGFGIRQITEPIFRLMGAAREVAQGNLGHEIEVHSRDELEDLSHQFNSMSRQLAHSYATIKDREERLRLVLEGTNDGIWDWNVKTGEVYYSPRWKGMLGYDDDEIAHQFEEWQKLVHPEDLEKSLSLVQDHLESDKDLYYLEHRLRHKDGSYRCILARGVTIRDELGQPVRMVGSHSDITLRKEAEDALRKAYETLEERVEERTRELETLNAITALVNRSMDLDEVLRDALDKTLRITNADFGAVYRVEGSLENQWLSPEEAGTLSVNELYLNPLVCRGRTGEPVCIPERLPLPGSGFDLVMDKGQPLVWETGMSAGSPAMIEMLEKEGVQQGVSVPLLVKNRLVGAIQFGSRHTRSYSPEELRLLAAIGQQVGVAVENARLHGKERVQVQQAATMEERARLARELHDSVTQSLYSVTLLAEASARLLSAGDQVTASGYLRELRDTAQESLREMRLLIYELRPIHLEKSGLAEALRMRLEAVEARSGIKTVLDVEGQEQLSFDVKQELYQMAQESLNNVLKHANASSVRVQLSFRGAETCLEIADDGAGFTVEKAVKSGGLGLGGMQERAGKIGGKLEIDSAPGKGTRVRITIAAKPAGPAGTGGV
jgi:PAS domain S-box-containing protein